MKNSELTAKLWNLCNILRDDGITYHQYVTELTYILFLKMNHESSDGMVSIPKEFSWTELVKKSGRELKDFYSQMLEFLGNKTSGIIKEIFTGARTEIDEPKNLEKLIKSVDSLNWQQIKQEGLGTVYESLLEKNASEKKSGAGQYFTPRVLVNLMTELIAPKPFEKCCDPACGTFGFMIAAKEYVQKHGDLPQNTAQYFTGMELVRDTYRLALMNASLHGLYGGIFLGDTLSSAGTELTGYDIVLTNPPFGTKRGGERALRTDLPFASTSKQLNFLQHIYLSLIPNGTSRAAVIVPDNVLFSDGDAEKIRIDLMEKCSLHTILRLPAGLFYAQGLKTNILFFTRSTKDTGATKETWFYDMRTGIPAQKKNSPLTKESFAAFVSAYNAKDRSAIKDERWSCFTREQIRQGGNSLDLGLIPDTDFSFEKLPTPKQAISNSIQNLNEALAILNSIAGEVENL